MPPRRSLLFSAFGLRRLTEAPGAPAEPVPSLHAFADGVLFKDTFLSFDDISAVEGAPGHDGRLVLRVQGGSHVFTGAHPAFFDRLRETWSGRRGVLERGWRRVRAGRFSLSVPEGWIHQDVSHPRLRLRLFSKSEEGLLNLMAYETREPGTNGLLEELVEKLLGEFESLRVLSRGTSTIDGFHAERLVLEEQKGEPAVVSDAWFLSGPGQLVKLQFLFPSRTYASRAGLAEKIAGSLRWA
jgi:hypothetical protein